MMRKRRPTAPGQEPGGSSEPVSPLAPLVAPDESEPVLEVDAVDEDAPSSSSLAVHDPAPRLPSIISQLSPDPVVEAPEDSSIPDRLRAIIAEELSVSSPDSTPQKAPWWSGISTAASGLLSNLRPKSKQSEDGASPQPPDTEEPDPTPMRPSVEESEPLERPEPLPEPFAPLQPVLSHVDEEKEDEPNDEPPASQPEELPPLLPDDEDVEDDAMEMPEPDAAGEDTDENQDAEPEEPAEPEQTDEPEVPLIEEEPEEDDEAEETEPLPEPTGIEETHEAQDDDPFEELLDFEEPAAEDTEEREKPSPKRRWILWTGLGAGLLAAILTIPFALSGPDPSSCQEAAASLTTARRTWDKQVKTAKEASGLAADQLEDPSLASRLAELLSSKTPAPLSCPSDANQSELDATEKTISSALSALRTRTKKLEATTRRVVESKAEKDLDTATAGLDSKLGEAKTLLDSSNGAVGDEGTRQSLQQQIEESTATKDDAKRSLDQVKESTGKLEAAMKKVSDSVAAKQAADQASAAAAQQQRQQASPTPAAPKRTTTSPRVSTPKKRYSAPSQAPRSTPSPSTPAPSAPNPSVGVTIG